MEGQPGPSACPTNHLFVLPNLLSEVLEQFHSFKFTCHPGILQTLQAIRQWLWWPTLREVTQEFLKACQVCNQSKTLCQSLTGLLHPLPTPHCPWSHISVDFFKGLPTSQGFRVILIIVDRFCKMTHLVSLPPLPTLPSAKKTAQLVLLHVVRLHGLPNDVVSDRGPQFTSTF